MYGACGWDDEVLATFDQDLIQSAREAAQELGLPRRDVYQLALGLVDRD